MQPSPGFVSVSGRPALASGGQSQSGAGAAPTACSPYLPGAANAANAASAASAASAAGAACGGGAGAAAAVMLETAVVQQAAVQQAAAQVVQAQVELAAVRAEAAAQQRLQQAMHAMHAMRQCTANAPAHQCTNVHQCSMQRRSSGCSRHWLGIG